MNNDGTEQEITSGRQAAGLTRLRPGDRLSEGQTLRLYEAVAMLKAKKAALAAGYSNEQIQDHFWVIDVKAMDVAPGGEL